MRSLKLKLSLSLNVLLLVACGSAGLKGKPKWDGKLFAGDPATGSVVRAQSVPPESISAFDPAFKEMVCMSYADLSCMYFSFVQNCRAWGTLTPSCPNIPKATMDKFIQMYAHSGK